MVFVLCVFSVAHCVPSRCSWEGETLERTAGGGCSFGELRGLFGGEGSRAGRSGKRRVAGRLQPTGAETAQRSSQHDPEVTE